MRIEEQEIKSKESIVVQQLNQYHQIIKELGIIKSYELIDEIRKETDPTIVTSSADHNLNIIGFIEENTQSSFKSTNELLMKVDEDKNKYILIDGHKFKLLAKTMSCNIFYCFYPGCPVRVVQRSDGTLIAPQKEHPHKQGFTEEQAKAMSGANVESDSSSSSSDDEATLPAASKPITSTSSPVKSKLQPPNSEPSTSQSPSKSLSQWPLQPTSPLKSSTKLPFRPKSPPKTQQASSGTPQVSSTVTQKSPFKAPSLTTPLKETATPRKQSQKLPTSPEIPTQIIYSGNEDTASQTSVNSRFYRSDAEENPSTPSSVHSLKTSKVPRCYTQHKLARKYRHPSQEPPSTSESEAVADEELTASEKKRRKKRKRSEQDADESDVIPNSQQSVDTTLTMDNVPKSPTADVQPVPTQSAGDSDIQGEKKKKKGKKKKEVADVPETGDKTKETTENVSSGPADNQPSSDSTSRKQMKKSRKRKDDTDPLETVTTDVQTTDTESVKKKKKSKDVVNETLKESTVNPVVLKPVDTIAEAIEAAVNRVPEKPTSPAKESKKKKKDKKSGKSEKVPEVVEVPDPIATPLKVNPKAPKADSKQSKTKPMTPVVNELSSDEESPFVIPESTASEEDDEHTLTSAPAVQTPKASSVTNFRKLSISPVTNERVDTPTDSLYFTPANSVAGDETKSSKNSSDGKKKGKKNKKGDKVDSNKEPTTIFDQIVGPTQESSKIVPNKKGKESKKKKVSSSATNDSIGKLVFGGGSGSSQDNLPMESTALPAVMQSDTDSASKLKKNKKELKKKVSTESGKPQPKKVQSRFDDSSEEEVPQESPIKTTVPLPILSKVSNATVPMNNVPKAVKATLKSKAKTKAAKDDSESSSEEEVPNTSMSMSQVKDVPTLFQNIRHKIAAKVSASERTSDSSSSDEDVGERVPRLSQTFSDMEKMKAAELMKHYKNISPGSRSIAGSQAMKVMSVESSSHESNADTPIKKSIKNKLPKVINDDGKRVFNKFDLAKRTKSSK